MVDPSLQNYIDSSLASGFSREQIRETLLQSGWDPESVTEALAAIPEPLPKTPELTIFPEPSRPRPNRRRKVIRGTALTLLVLLVLSGGTIALGEQGYIPSVSRIYRKTMAPLVWKGTTGNPDSTIVQMVQAMSTVTTLHEESSLTVSAKVANPETSVSFDRWPKLVPYLSFMAKKDARTFANVTGLSDDASFATEQYDTTTTPSDFRPESLLPAAVTLTSTMDYDDKKNFHLKIGTDLGDLVDKLGTLGPLAPSLPRTSENEGMIVRDAKKAFFKGTIVPYMDKSDEGKFLSFDIPERFFEETEKQKQLPEEYDKTKKGLKKDELDAWNAIASVVWSDKGVVRQDGTAQAHYQIRIDPETARKIEAIPSVKACNCTIDTKSIIESNTTATINLYLEQRTQRIASMDLLFESTPVDINVTFTVSFKIKFAYALPTPITAPDSKQVIEEDGMSYLMKAGGGILAPIISVPYALDGARTRSENSIRKSTIADIGKSIEMYKFRDDNATESVPSTNGVVQRLDSTTNALATTPGLLSNIAFPLLDPDPDKYYYSYVSDGTSYTVSCVVTSDSDPDTVVGLFRVRDGNFEEVPR